MDFGQWTMEYLGNSMFPLSEDSIMVRKTMTYNALTNDGSSRPSFPEELTKMPGPVELAWHDPSVGHGQRIKDLSTRCLTIDIDLSWRVHQFHRANVIHSSDQ